MIKYFAYGSNMDMEDFAQRCRVKDRKMITPINIRIAKLYDYEISFNYYSRGREGGAANIMNSPGSFVQGLIMEVSEADHTTLRWKEGFKMSYEEIKVQVECGDGSIISDVIAYKVVPAKQKSVCQPPTEQYLDLIIKNARFYQFDEEYIKTLESIPTRMNQANLG